MRWNIRYLRYTFRRNAHGGDISQCNFRKKYEKVEEKKEKNAKKKGEKTEEKEELKLKGKNKCKRGKNKAKKGV